MVVSFTMVFVGMLLLLFGPSTTHRIQFYSEVYGVVSSPITLFFKNFVKTFSSFFYFAKYALLLMLLEVFLLKGHYTKKFLLESGIMFFLAFSTAMILASAPYQEPRAFFISSILIIMIFVRWIYYVPQYNKIIFVGLVMVFLSCFPFFEEEYKNMKDRHKYYNQRIKKIKSQLSKSGDIVVKKMPIKSSTLVLVGDTDDEAARMERYFNLKNRKIIISDEIK